MSLTLTGANQKTEWVDLRAASDSACFLLTGDFTTPVGIHYSNLDAISKEDGYTVDESTWSEASGPLRLPFGVARFVRAYSGVSWSAGKTCTFSFAPTRNSRGQNYVPKVQDQYDESVT